MSTHSPPRHRPITRLAHLALIAGIAAFTACDHNEAPDAAIAPSEPARAPLGIAAKPLIATSSGDVVADELLVRFPDAMPADASKLLASVAGGEIVYVAPASGYAVVRFADANAAAAGADRLVASGLVADVARNHVMHGEAEASGTGIGTSPSTTIGAMQWNLYAMGLDPFGPRLGAAGVTVAVLDTGVAYEAHADALGSYELAPTLAETTFAPGYDFINDDAHPNDDQRHGTHIAGVIAASSGIASFAPGATILPVKVLDGGNSGSELALAEGIRYATDHGARVINMSLAFPPTYFPSRLLQEAVDYAQQHGVILIAAVGNHGEDLVAYPAAFRDVIAVGASDLPDSYVTGGEPVAQWQTAQDALERAPYSNRSYKVDVLAPGGRINGDANSDGMPEGILAQTFEPGQPTNFGYYFYAGTSQAAAEVSGVVAAMLKLDPALDAHAVRAILVESSNGVGGFMTTSAGRGVLRADLALAAAAAGDTHAAGRERFNANVVVTLHDDGGDVRARARVEILESASGDPAAGVNVYGLFTGAAFGAGSALTDENGVAELWSGPLSGNLVVAFQVDAVSRGTGAYAAFDRPRGFLRIESQSLERLTAFSDAIEEVILGGEGDGSASGSGIGTSPSNPNLPGSGIVIDPLRTPVTIGFDPVLFPGTGYRRTVLLPNFSWGLATTPMSVAVDEAWFFSSFSDAAARSVLSHGSGLGESSIVFDDTSFAGAPPPVPEDMLSVPLIVLTFASGTGIGTSPSDPESGGAGIGTSPSIGVIGRVIVDRAWSGIDTALANDIDRVVNGVLSEGTGIGTSPSFEDDGPWNFPAPIFGGLSGFAHRYGQFSGGALAAPSASYGSALGAASMPMAPVAPESDGPGVGYVPAP